MGGSVEGGAMVATLLLSWQSAPERVPLQRAVLIWWTMLPRWLVMAVALEMLSLALGMGLARTWSPTVRRQPLAASCSSKLSESEAAEAAGMMEKPMGRRGIEEGSSPFIASCMDSTSTVE